MQLAWCRSAAQAWHLACCPSAPGLSAPQQSCTPDWTVRGTVRGCALRLRTTSASGQSRQSTRSSAEILRCLSPTFASVNPRPVTGSVNTCTGHASRCVVCVFGGRGGLHTIYTQAAAHIPHKPRGSYSTHAHIPHNADARIPHKPCSNTR